MVPSLKDIRWIRALKNLEHNLPPGGQYRHLLNLFSSLYRTNQFDAIFLYWSSGCSKEEDEEILKLLDSWIIKDRPTVMIGDVNMNFSEESKITEFFKDFKEKKKEFTQLITKSTCDTGSLLDHIYVNEALKNLGITTQQRSAYYTDHDVITIYIPK